MVQNQRQYDEYMRQRSKQIGLDEKPSLIQCPSCGGTFLEQVEVGQYSKEQIYMLGIRPTTLSHRSTFWVLRCICCGKVSQPPVTRGLNKSLTADWDEFLTELENLGVSKVVKTGKL